MKLPAIINEILDRVVITLSIATLLGSIAVPFLVVYNFGFELDSEATAQLDGIYRGLLTFLWVTITLSFILGNVDRNVRHTLVRRVGYGLFSTVSILCLSVSYGILQADAFLSVATSTGVVVIMLIIVSLMRISSAVTAILSARTNPSLILAGSFFLIILIGSLLLMLPNATIYDISYLDSLFLSTSAVCVTGLTPIDISQTFTITGQVIIMLLIQIGGLGIMTITSSFGLFFLSGGSFSNQLLISDMFSDENLSGLLRMLVRIIAVTFFIEALGALMLYLAVIGNESFDQPQAIYFAVFHSISAFCNAGFSTFSQNLFDPTIRGIDSVMWTISFLVIFGGIGFPIFSNLLSILRNKIRNLFVSQKRIIPRQWSLNSYIVLRTTAILLISGWIVITALEWNRSLAEFDLWGKITQGFLASVTPRTAGFNGVDMSLFSPVTILVTIFLMWVGGAPQSTAGGVKVTTLYLALKNIYANSTNATISVRRREIPSSSVRRAFSVIMLSCIILGVAIVCLSLLNPEIEVIKLIFEAVSAISTVGLTLNVTPTLGAASKSILIALMFIGRIGVISIFMLFIKRHTRKPYQYPEENILIT